LQLCGIIIQVTELAQPMLKVGNSFKGKQINSGGPSKADAVSLLFKYPTTVVQLAFSFFMDKKG